MAPRNAAASATEINTAAEAINKRLISPSNPLRVALYLRVAQISQHGKQHLVDQERRLREYAAAREWIVVSTYTDAGFSGDSGRRPGLQQMMDDTLRAKSFDIVLINDDDRFFRNVEGAALYRHLLAENHIELISIAAPPSAAD